MHQPGPLLMGLSVLAVLVVLAVLAGESAGWPFLVGPMQRWLTDALDRQVTFTGQGEGRGVHIRLLGSVRIDAASIEIAAPAWSKARHTLLATNAELRLGYRDLWNAAHGEPLRVRAIRADQLDAQIERLEDGRASWQFGRAKHATRTGAALRLPSFRELRVRDGTMRFADQVLQANLDARFSLTESETGSLGAGASAAPGPASALAGSRTERLQFHARGSYRKLPLRAELIAWSAASPAGADTGHVVRNVTLDAVFGLTRLSFRGTAADPLHVTGLRGHFDAGGPSLAALGDSLDVTLPTTGPFKTDGYLDKQGELWKIVFTGAAIGESRLAGAFTYDDSREVPVLAGRLTGSRLLLKDLGPAIGTAPDASAAAASGSTPAPHRVLPDRHFDLPSLLAMDANVLIDVAHVDFGTPLLGAIEPFHAHLRLYEGVLSLADIDARAAEGRLTGGLGLDGREKKLAIWNADLQLAGVHLERWVHQERKDNAPPWVSGELDGRVRVGGRGRSTAEILASLEGSMRFHLRNGRISHLAVEVAGIDLAQALGAIVRGDKALTVDCNIFALVVEKGVAKPQPFVLDTRDSTVWIDGTASLADETLDLTAVVSPRDASLLTARSPIRVRGTFSKPSVSLDKAPVVARAVAAVALHQLLRPIAAVVPFIDPGARDEAERDAAACAALLQRGDPASAAPAEAARAAAKPHR